MFETQKNRRGVYLMAVLLALIVLMAPMSAFAHRPSKLSLTYDAVNKRLTVSITHSVSNPQNHFVEFVEIKKNGTLLKRVDYDNQPDKSTFSITYEVPAVSGDIFKVNAKCNKFGSRRAKLTVK